MIVYLSCAKTMAEICNRDLERITTQPHFLKNAEDNAMRMASCTPAEISTMLGVNDSIALDVWSRYQHFFDSSVPSIPAVFAYDGMAFRKLSPETMTDVQLEYANSHLFISSFLYGLLRPLDAIRRYRLEGRAVLPGRDGVNMFAYWKPLLTDFFIERIKADDGILVNLASDEMKNLLDWKRVCREVKVVSPSFRVATNGRLRTVVIYAKMCRGAMARYILENRLTDPEQLKSFEFEGFRHDPSSGEFDFNMI